MQENGEGDGDQKSGEAGRVAHSSQDESGDRSLRVKPENRNNRRCENLTENGKK